jgi:hypothetical protein
VADQDDWPETERLEEIEEIGGECGDLARPRLGSDDATPPDAAEHRADEPQTRREQGEDVVPGARHVGEAVHEDDGDAVLRALVEVLEVGVPGPEEPLRSRPLRSRPPRPRPLRARAAHGR